jgi:nitrate/nitrite transporter NarK
MSPALGSWRNVLFLYGALSIGIGMLWILTKSNPVHENSANHSQKTPLKQTLLIVLRSKRVWVFGVTHMCYMGCIVGFMGYLPIYLRNAGWTPVSADGALAAFNASGMVAAIPLTLLSRKLGSKKIIIVSAVAIAFVCVGLLSVFDNGIVWLLVIPVGIMRDGYVAVLMTMIMETEDIGINFSGTAIGLVLSFSGLGSFFAPPIGNSLAGFGPGMPFLFWACLLIIPLFIMRFVKDTGKS